MVTADNLSWTYIPLRLAYGLVPIVAVADKSLNLLAHWDKYLPANAATMLPVSPTVFMYIVGIIEIVAVLAVLTFLTRLGAYVVMTGSTIRLATRPDSSICSTAGAVIALWRMCARIS